MAQSAFPLFHKLADRRVLLVGGGELALRKARLLAKATEQLVLVAPSAQAELIRFAKEWRARKVAKADLDGVSLIVCATGIAEIDEAVADWARQASIPVNVPDRPEISSVIMPALVDRHPVMIAIGTDGTAPALARRVREQIERLLSPHLGALARAIETLRGLLSAKGHDAPARRRAVEALIDGPRGAAILRGETPALSDAELDLGAIGVEGHVSLVGAGPGDPDLLTLKALRALQDADVIVYDKLVDARVLDLARRDAERIYVGKSKADHTLGQDNINALLVREARAGRRVVRLKGGDPFIFGRGGEEAEALLEADIAFDIVPGITAALGCAASAAIPLTHREIVQGVTLITGHAAEGEPDLDWNSLARLKHTLALYMGVSNGALIAERLIAAGLAAQTPVAIIENGTRSDERVIEATLATLGQALRVSRIEAPALVLIGEVVARRAKHRPAALAEAV